MTHTTELIPTAAHPAELTEVGTRKLFMEITGEGTDVVMVHGLGGATSFYDPIVTELSQQFRFLRYDFNGHGRSPLTGEISIDSLAQELAEVIRTQTTSGKAHVIGHSMGTLIVQQLATTHPELVDKIVLLGPVQAQPDKAKAATRQRAALVRDQGMSAVAEAISRGATADQAAEHNPLLRPLVRQLLLTQNAEAYAQACEALAAATNPDLHAITAPVLLITGDQDAVSTPETNDAIASELKNAQRHTISGIGHWTVLEAPDFVTDYLATFLQDT
ncbi:3-oxoadipate enol-lactonase 2 (plasmid) [Corynebacterium occultum]|uniref:3-oxoadipate enol-lactonase 2 n=1 Tax=Corynebacterium occultum TaxID=2675219 RepID=A0A6B8VXF0_9CORY|nr:alpha/beta fold hydrolase [Corynebacterium occultum]QGU08803.1 3-oxoadipate enol-lactonase 2 [Corynebacterium occultum]